MQITKEVFKEKILLKKKLKLELEELSLELQKSSKEKRLKLQEEYNLKSKQYNAI